MTDVLPQVVPVRQSQGDASPPIQQLLVLVAVAVAAVGQGGYYLGPRVALSLLLAGAGVVVVWHGLAWRRVTRQALLVLLALAVWAAAAGVLAGHVADSLPTVAMLGCVGLVMSVAASASRVQRETLIAGVIGVGVLVAVSGWLGVVLRLSRWAHVDGGLWRAATTVTYANAAAAMLGPLALLALARLTDRPSVGRRCVGLLLLVGVGVTLSRAGLTGLVLGFCLLTGLLGVRRTVSATAPCLLGAFIGLVALVPSIPASSQPRPGWAAAGLVAAILVAATPPRPVAWWLASFAIAALAVCSALIVYGLPHGQAWRALASDRASISSPDRASESRAAAALVRTHPWAGVGPGRATLFWFTSERQLVTDRYAHDEYLQLAAEQGLVGIALLAALIGVVARQMGAGRRTGPSQAIWAGAVAGLVSVAIQSGFDFLWHVPVVLLIAALMAGCGFPINTHPDEGRKA